MQHLKLPYNIIEFRQPHNHKLCLIIVRSKTRLPHASASLRSSRECLSTQLTRVPLYAAHASASLRSSRECLSTQLTRVPLYAAHASASLRSSRECLSTQLGHFFSGKFLWSVDIGLENKWTKKICQLEMALGKAGLLWVLKCIQCCWVILLCELWFRRRQVTDWALIIIKLLEKNPVTTAFELKFVLALSCTAGKFVVWSYTVFFSLL